MVDRKDFIGSDGDVSTEMLSAITVFPAGLGERANGSPEDKKKSGIAARLIAALLEKKRKEREKIDQQLFQQHKNNHNH